MSIVNRAHIGMRDPRYCCNLQSVATAGVNCVQVSELRAQLAAADERAAKAAQDTEAAHQEVRQQQQDGLPVTEEPAPVGQPGEVNLLLD